MEFIAGENGKMIPNAILISKPQFDIPTILSLSNEMLGRSPARIADSANLTGLPHLLACLASFRDKDAKPTIRGGKDAFDLLHFGFIIVADEPEMIQILEILGGMPFAVTETRLRGVQTAIVVDTLHRWREAVLRGCRQDQSETIRYCFDKIFIQFQNIGLADVFGTKKSLPDRTFFIEGPK